MDNLEPKIIVGLKAYDGTVGDLILLREGQTLDVLKEGLVAIRGGLVGNSLLALFPIQDIAFACVGNAWGSVCKATKE